MGIVYRAYDEKLQRTVAVKTVQVAALSDYARAQREARALARVSSHNNIATIFDVLMEPDAVILVLEWIDGVPFSELIDDGENLSTSLAILEAVAHATEHGHSQGVVHRDLKPSNVLIDRDGEPKLVDFGIARVADGKAKITETGAILGTPAYMAPEQALGELDKVGPATDVYAIGVMLYEVLTGRCPFEGSMQSIIAAHAEREAPMPNSVARNRIPAELEAIALKALAKDPAERYSTALELAEDLCAYREGRAIAARRPGFLRRAHRFVRRHRGVSAALLLGFVGVTSAVLWGLWSIQQAKARADLEKRLERELLEIETSMERAVLQPLHDMSTERDHLRERLRRLAEDRSIDGIAPAEVAFALGSGYLDLQDLQRASDQFSRARELGLRRKQLMEAAAEADTLLYLTKRQQDRAGLGIPETEIEALRSKALASVQRALDRGAWDERYRPILQTLQEDPDVRPELDIPTSGRSAVLALHLAKERLANLSGPALSKGLAEARRLADESLEVRRSDPLLHSLRCGIAVELYAAADRSAAVDFDDVWERRDELSTWCRAAVSAGSDQPEGYIASIAFFTRFADLSMQLGHDTSELVAEGARIAAQGLERWPDDVLLLRLAGQIALSQAAVDRESGEDTSAHFARAAKHAERARQLQPDLPAVYLLSSNVSFNQAMLKMRQGGDYFEEIRAAVDYLDQGLARQNDEDWASDARYRATSVMAMAQLQAGKDPREALAKAIGIGERVLAANPDSFAMLANKTTAHYVRARWAIDHGLSPEDDLAMAAELTARANKIREASTVLSNAVGIAALDAEYRAMRGLPMDDLVARGIQWGERAIEIAPDASAEVYANLARTLLFASTRDPDVISQAMEYAERGLAMIEEHPELRWLRGELLVASGQPKKAKKDLEFAAERGVIEASLGLVAVLASQASSGSDDALQQAQALVVELKKERPDLGAVDFAESKLLEASGAAAETVRAARARAVAKNRWLQIPDEPAVADP